MNSFEQEFFQKLISLTKEYNVSISSRNEELLFKFSSEEIMINREFTTESIHDRLNYIKEANWVNIYQES